MNLSNHWLYDNVFKYTFRVLEEQMRQTFDITCSNYIEKPTFKQGSDLADIYFDLQNKNTNNMVLSQPEKIVKQLIKSNPSVKLLIDTFDLVDEGGNSLGF